MPLAREAAQRASLELTQSCWRLRDGAPELGVVAEHDPRASLLHLPEALEDGEGGFFVCDDARQMHVVERLLQVARVAAQHELAVRGLHAQRLVPRRVAISRQAHDRAVAED